jgi:hypothetical protein
MPWTIRIPRNRLIRLAVCAVVSTTVTDPAAAQRHNTVSFEEGEEGWYPLFDGRGLDGFVVAGEAVWQVRDGQIVAESGGQSLLLTDETFSDFELRVDFLAAPGANSGVFLRVTAKDLAAGVEGYEVNVSPPSSPFPTGSVMRVALPPGGGVPKFGVLQKADAGESEEWRTYHVVAKGGSIAVTLDGEAVAELADPSPIAEGYLGLQHNQGNVAFRNVKVRRLR